MNPLKKARIEKGLTLRQLEEKSKVPRDTISKIENDKRRANPLTLNKLANALEIPLDTLMPLSTGYKANPENFRLAA